MIHFRGEDLIITIGNAESKYDLDELDSVGIQDLIEKSISDAIGGMKWSVGARAFVPTLKHMRVE